MSDAPSKPIKLPPQMPMLRILTDQSRAPRLVHKFGWARVGSDILFETGYLDIPQVRSVADEINRGVAPSEPVHLYVTDRFTFSPLVAIDLLKTAQQIVDELRGEGLIPKLEGEGLPQESEKKK